MDPARDLSQDKPRRTYRVKILSVIVALVIIASGFTIYYTELNRHKGKENLVIYTYNSFLEYGGQYSKAFKTVFGTFEAKYNVNITVTNVSNLVSRLALDKRSGHTADIVIGLTNIDSTGAIAQGLLDRYIPPAQKYINESLLKDMGNSSSFVTPYEYSYLGIDFNKSFVHGGLFKPTFQDLLSSSNSTNLLMQNPLTDSTGEAFLLWEIAYYKYVLHDNWTTWWSAIKANASGHIYSDWTDAFNFFETGGNTNLVVSYLTDPAYNIYSGYGNGTGSEVVYHNGQAYGWRTLYGVGIINGSANLPIDKEFVNYFLSPTVQNVLPTNEWMYPANSTVDLPSVFSILPNQNSIHALNDYMTTSVISGNLQTWETQWTITMQ